MFEAFRDTFLEHYKLDPEDFYTSSGLAWKACLTKAWIRLELLTNPDMLLMFECGIRGGIIQAVHRYAAANNKYMRELYNPKEESSYLQYQTQTIYTDERCHNRFQMVDLDGLTLSPMRLVNSQNFKTKVTY